MPYRRGKNDNELTTGGRYGDTYDDDRGYRHTMSSPHLRLLASKAAPSTRQVVLTLIALCLSACCAAQDVPILSGGAGFFTNTNDGTTYFPEIEPLIAAPLGNRLLFESRAVLTEAFFPKGGNQPGYDHAHFVALTYLQGDYLATPHLTIVGGSFLTPFGTYNERLSPIWIGNFQDGPLIAGVGTMGTSTGVGGELRGSAVQHKNYSVDYAAYFSAQSGNEQFNSERSSGGRVSLYLLEKRLEVGFSYGRLLQGTHENFYGTHLWWEPKDTAFRFRSEFASGQHAYGYWAEADYRTQAFGGLDSWVGRFEPVFRMQQTFRRDNISSDSLPSVNTQRVDVGLDYNLPHNTRILTDYSRQFASTGDHNIWETGIVYRFLFPAWKGK